MAEFANIYNNGLSVASPWTANMDAGGFRLIGLAAGTEGSPSIQPTGDTNTGIRFSAADTIDLVTGGADRWQITSAGHLLAVDDATYDIGASGATRPRHVYASGNGVFGGTLNVVGATTLDGHVDLGNAAADNIAINGTVVRNLLFTDNTYDIGASGATRPRDLFLSRNLTLGGSVLSNLIFTDNTYDIGASGATRPRHVYAAGNAVFAGTGAFAGTTLAVRGVTYTWPAADGAASTFLQTNGAGALSWTLAPLLAPELTFGPGIGDGNDSTYAANAVYLFPFTTHRAVTVTRIRVYVAVQSGNIDVGIYAEGGGRVVSSGSTAVGGMGLQSVTIASTNLTVATKYWLAIALDNATASLRRANTQAGPYSNSISASFPLPATLAEPASGNGTMEPRPGAWLY